MGLTEQYGDPLILMIYSGVCIGIVMMIGYGVSQALRNRVGKGVQVSAILASVILSAAGAGYFAASSLSQDSADDAHSEFASAVIEAKHQ